MHAALHFFSQAWHLLHLDLSITGRNIANREKKLRVVPTGQIVLHQVLPFFHARTTTATNVTAATIRVGRLLSQTSSVTNA